MQTLKEDYEYLKKNDPFFSFKTVEEWVAFLKETEESDVENYL